MKVINTPYENRKGVVDFAPVEVHLSDFEMYDVGEAVRKGSTRAFFEGDDTFLVDYDTEIVSMLAHLTRNEFAGVAVIRDSPTFLARVSRYVGDALGEGAREELFLGEGEYTAFKERTDAADGMLCIEMQEPVWHS